MKYLPQMGIYKSEEEDHPASDLLHEVKGCDGGQFVDGLHQPVETVA